MLEGLEAVNRDGRSGEWGDTWRLADEVNLVGLFKAGLDGQLTRPSAQPVVFGITADMLTVRYIITPKQEAEKSKRLFQTMLRVMLGLRVAPPLMRPFGGALQPEVAAPFNREAAINDVLGRLADLLRDVVGNPFRPVTFDPTWSTPEVRSVAADLYASREYDRMEDLEGELWEAGCRDTSVLTHCCYRMEHFRGCWVSNTFADSILSSQVLTPGRSRSGSAAWGGDGWSGVADAPPTFTPPRPRPQAASTPLRLPSAASPVTPLCDLLAARAGISLCSLCLLIDAARTSRGLSDLPRRYTNSLPADVRARGCTDAV